MPKKPVPEGMVGEASESDDTLSSTDKSRKSVSLKDSIFHTIFTRLKKVKKDDGTSLVYALRLPNRRSNPDYYETVANPIDPDKISAKVKARKYETVEEMAEDVKLLVSNTHSFFGAASQEGRDATFFEEAFLKGLQESQQPTSKAPSVASSSSSLTNRSARRSMKREKTDDEETDFDAASVAASEISETSTTTSHRITVNEQALKVFFSSIVTHELEEGRQISQTFSTLPSKQLYPQYYQIITNPIDLRTIAQRILNGFYHTFGELERDFVQMARNAKHFNEPKSQIYQDAVSLLRIVKEKKGAVKRRLKADPDEIQDDVSAHEITEDYANLPDVTDMVSPMSKIEDNDETEDYEGDEEGEEGSVTASSTPAQPAVVKRRRGRPRKQPLDNLVATPVSPAASEGSADRRSSSSATTTPVGVGGVGSGGNSAVVDISSLMLDEPVAPPGSPPHMAPFIDPSVPGEEQLIPTMLSTASVGSLRWWGEHVLEAICTATNSMGTLLALPFMRLPSKKIYPDYFRRIPNPICLAKIRRKIKRNEYHSLADVRTDIDRVFMNAQAYNVEGSDIHNVAVYLQQLTKSKFVELSQIAAKVENSGMIPTGAKRRQSRSTLGESDDFTPTKRRHPMTAEEARNKRLNNLYNAVYNHVDEDGHRPRDTFMVLPSKDDYPDYYDVIQEPIDLTMIKERMETNKYPTHQAMVADLRLMFNNARRYNEEDSQVYRDADTLDRVVKKRLKSLGPYASCPQGMARSPGIRPQQESASPYGSMLTIAQHSGPAIPPLQRLMYEVFQAIREYRDPMGRQLSTPFLRLPSKAELPTYYEFIKRPIELQGIAKYLLQGGYTDFEEFMSDIFLMFDNACAFNEPDSQIYKDTLVLHQVALAKRNMLLSAAFSSGTVIPGLMPSSAPDIVPGIRRLLTSLHNAMLTACDTDGRGLVDSLIAGDGTEISVTSATAARLAALHRSVAAGAYRRLDRLQADWLEVLRRARVGEEEERMAALSEVDAMSNRPTPQQRQDAAELARRWVRLRDSMCRRAMTGGTTNLQSNVAGESSGSESGGGASSAMSLPTGWHIVSTAMSYTEAALERDLKNEVAQQEPMVFSDDDGEEDLPTLEDGENEVQSVESKGQVYRVNDYVYIEPLRQDVTQCHVGRITRISEVSAKRESEGEGTNLSPTEIRVRVALYMRPSEAKPSRRRRLLAAEVFRTASNEVVSPSKLAGHCLVMHISHFIRCRPRNIEERDVYVCESQYSITGQIFVKIRRWGAPTPNGIELEDRQAPFVPTRLPPSEPLESALEQVNTSSFSCMTFPLPRPIQTVVDEVSKTEGVVSYEQYVGENNLVIKQGDCLFFPSPSNASDRQILRIDRLWKNMNEETVFVTGSIFVFPVEVDHLPTRVFFPREVFLTNNDKATFPISSAMGKCLVMRAADFFVARPTSYREGEVFVCESKFFEDEKVIRKLKKGFKKYKFSPDTVEDEFFFFTQPIVPHKEASPLLVKASPSPLSLDQLNQPPSAAVSCVMAAANGQTTSAADFAPRLAPAPPQSPDVGQLAFMEVGLDRSGKKRKLRKPPSGYVIYAGEVRKKLLQDRPDAPFGEISREVGLMWRQMPSHERDIYERKAQVIKRRMEEQETQQKARLQEQEKLMQVHPHHHEMVSHGDPHHVAMAPGMPSALGAGSAQPTAPTMPSALPVSTPHHAAAAMQFYQATSGAPGAGPVIQLMHATTTSSTVANAAPSPMQPRSGIVESPLVAGATVLANPMSHAPVLATTAGQQVVYQFANQQASGIAPPPNVNLGGPQVILTHPHHPQMGGHHAHPHHQHQAQPPPQPFGVVPTQPLPQSRQHAIPTQQVQAAQQLNPTTMEVTHTAVNGGGSGGTAVVPQPMAAATVAAIQAQTAPQGGAVTSAPARAPSPLFVSVPPRTSRVLHSEIYQRQVHFA
uniref:Bromo domain-containing protein n=1 Tax=Mesocestoides corti TaxID=53468 RepID=A0A5K3EUD3_MESCO